MLIIALTHWLQPQISLLPNAQHEDERFLRCLFHSMRLLDGSLELRLDHTFNPRPISLSCLVRRVECVLDRLNTGLSGSLVELQQLLNHEFESVKTFLSDEHNCCIHKRLVIPLRTCLRQDIGILCALPRTCTASGSFVHHRHLAPLRTTVDHWFSLSSFL